MPASDVNFVPLPAGHTEVVIALGTTEDAVGFGLEKPPRTKDW